MVAKKSTKKRSQVVSSNLAIIESIAKKKLSVEKKMQRFVAVTGMLLLIAVNFLGAMLLIPFLLFFDGIAEYTIIVVFAIGFGLLFNLMIHSMSQLGDKHHLIAGIIVPFCALIDFVILFTLLEKITETFKMTKYYDYTLIIILFMVAFIIPYLFDVIRGKHRFG